MSSFKISMITSAIKQMMAVNASKNAAMIASILVIYTNGGDASNRIIR